MNTLKLVMFISILCFSSCDLSTDKSQHIEGDSHFNPADDGADITYIKDARTGLCFAERGRGYTYSFTCVPCDSVEKLIKK